MICIVDCGIGNIASVANMVKKVGGEAKLSSSPDEVRRADKLILPGVGSFDAGVKALSERGLDAAVKDAVQTEGAKLLGICLGMQLLLDSSEEGSLPGLGLVPGAVRRFRVDDLGLRVPHMGWNVAHPTGESRLFGAAGGEERFYFVHSYHAECARRDDVAAVAHYGYDFDCAIESGPVMGVQFHPEKSHRFGKALFRRFLDI